MKILSTTLASILVLFVIVNVQSGASAKMPLAIGQPAPDFTLADLQGKTHSLKDYRGKIVVIAYIATQCPISNNYNDRMRAIATEYAGRNVLFLGINSNVTEPLAEVKSHAASHQLNFPILKDEDHKVADVYGAERTPEMFVIDPAGMLRYHGRIDNSREIAKVNRQDLRQALDEMLAGKPVSAVESKAFGCLIKREQSAKDSKAMGAQAKNFEPKVGTLKAADFKKYKDSAKGKVLIINFWATWCGPCVAEFPEFVAIDAKYRDKGVKLVGISADELADIQPKVVPFIKEQKAMFDILVQDVEDPQEMIDVVDKTWSGVLPATFVFDKQGNTLYSRYGIIDRDQLIAAIEKALK